MLVTIFILVYVYDILITGNDPCRIHCLIQTLASEFALKYLGSLSYVLGIEAVTHSMGLVLTQQRYIENLLEPAGMTNAKPVLTPISTSTKLSKAYSVPFSDPTKY